ncbi:MAG: superinfection immunity protein [Terriglobales bacterium]|jgi:predicted cation transporter
MVSFIILVLLYFLPALLAHNKHNFTAIFLLNAFLGWTVVGWFAALIWAAVDPPAPRPVVIIPAGNFCGACGAPSAHARCPHCGRP